MYSSRYGRGGWYKSLFFLLLGILIGQLIDLDIGIQPRTDRNAQSTIQPRQETPLDA